MIRLAVAALSGTAGPPRVPSTQCLLGPDLIPGCKGSLRVETLEHDPAGQADGAPPAQARATESVTFLLSGSATWQGDGGPERLEAGDGVFLPGGTLLRLAPGAPGPAICLVVLCAGAGDADSKVVGAITGGARCACRLPRSGGAGEDPAAASTGFLADAGGFIAMGVHWLATSQTVGARGVVVATSTFTPGGSHELHRHPDADEFFLVLEGGGEHLTTEGPVRLGRGDLAYIPAGEWHGFRTDAGVVTRSVYGYLGAGSLEQAGYELREANP